MANADYERVMREYATAGNQLIVGEAFAVEAAARKVAKDFPKTAFLMGSSGKPQAPNFSVFDNYIQEPAYLTGLIAGGMTQTNKIGLVGGFPIPEVNRLMHAFMAGAKEVNPKVEFTVTFINSWFDPPKAGSHLRHDRQGRRRAVRRALRRQRRGQGKRQAGHRQRDQHAAAVPRHGGRVRAVGHVAHDCAGPENVKAGSFKAEDYGPYSMMKHKGSSLSPLGTFEAKVPAEIKAKVKAREADILAGKFTVKVDDSQPKSTAK